MESFLEMSKFMKVVGLLFLPIAAILIVAAMLNGRAGKIGKGFFIQEYDEQNIYG
ncbi:MAG TPA: hypothetical protein VIS48_04420 [Candidatus Kryptonia bacterium]